MSSAVAVRLRPRPAPPSRGDGGVGGDHRRPSPRAPAPRAPRPPRRREVGDPARSCSPPSRRSDRRRHVHVEGGQQPVGQRDHRRPAPGSRWSAGPPPASGLPRWASVSRQSRAAHGVVPWARSPSRVSEPCSLRRAIARHCIGDRSCASSTTMWPKPVGRSISPATSSTQHGVGGADHRAALGVRGGLAQRSASCSASVSRSAGARRAVRVGAAGHQSSGVTAGQTGRGSR